MYQISSWGSRMGTAALLMTRCAPSRPVPGGGKGKQGRIKKAVALLHLPLECVHSHFCYGVELAFYFK